MSGIFLQLIGLALGSMSGKPSSGKADEKGEKGFSKGSFWTFFLGIVVGVHEVISHSFLGVEIAAEHGKCPTKILIPPPVALRQ